MDPTGPSATPATPAGEFADRLAAHRGELVRFARGLTRDGAAAEDLVQEALARAWEHRDGYRGAAGMRTWLHRIVHNLAVDRARRGGREVVVAEVEDRWRDDGYTVDAATVVARAETRAELEDALVRLPVIYRAVLVLHDVEGMTVRAIADLLDVSLPAAKQRLRRARMMLVTALATGAERRHALRGVPLSCWDARRLVSDYLDGELTAVRAATVERHLATCPTCPPLYAALVGATGALGSLRDPDTVVPEVVAERITRRPAAGPAAARG
ncbi:MAG: sigma-70 family RNA polymerase sigma factor [Kineosporiaceae bacterium]